ncbi:Protein Hook 3 [Homalodisca vitripennis]|nr:Protein Hook 3 [Homalodisca vitripennis]
MEEKLISTAFYNLGQTRHKELVDQRLLNLSQSQSFLARQRQPTSRRTQLNSK